MLWRSQFIPLLRGYNLEGYVNGSFPCPPATIPLSSSSAITTTITTSSSPSVGPNPAYIAWIQQDQILLGWILSSLSEYALSRVVGMTSSQQVWCALEKHYASRTKVRVHHLKLELQSLQKGDLSMSDYLQKAKTLADSLAAAAQDVSEEDLIEFILNGLGPDYNAKD